MEDSIAIEARRTKVQTRPFTLADAMILVAASALGLALARPVYGFLARNLMRRGDGYAPVHQVLSQIYAGSTAIFPVAAALSAATIVIRLRRPRPSLRKLARQPGLVACIAAISPLLAGLARRLAIIEHHWGSEDLLRSFVFTEWMRAGRDCGYGVIGTWAVLAFFGRWRPEPSWIDRLGRALGGIWIAAVVLETASALAWVSGW